MGKQQGNWIVEDDRIDSMTAWKNVGDKESLIRKGTLNVIGGTLLVCIPCAFLLRFGVSKILDLDSSFHQAPDSVLRRTDPFQHTWKSRRL